MGHVQFRPEAVAARAFPVLRPFARLEEGDRPRPGIAGDRYRQRPESAGVDGRADVTHADLPRQEILQGFVVQQRARIGETEAAEEQRHRPVQAAAHDIAEVGAVDVGHLQPAPHLRQIFRSRPEILRPAGQRRGVDRADRRARDHGKRVASRRRQLGDGLQGAGLIGPARAAARQHQARADPVGLRGRHGSP
jgi:hypothetical protein